MKPTHRLDFLGCPLDPITSADLLQTLTAQIKMRTGTSVIQFVNANKVAKIHEDPKMGEIMRRADYVLADGQPLLPMASLLGMKVPERIDGIGLMRKFLELADREKFSVYLLGAKQEVVEECVRQIETTYPGIRLAGQRNGYFDEDDIPNIAAGVAATQPDFLFLGMGSPMKERLADEWKNELGAVVIQGVGGSFDVMAGLVKRAPRWMQKLGIEWLYRVVQEPRRMFWRYFKTNTVCLWLFVKALVRRWFRMGKAREQQAAGCK